MTDTPRQAATLIHRHAPRNQPHPRAAAHRHKTDATPANGLVSWLSGGLRGGRFDE
jgi:hypothetical protein